jgi:hypothetical protein
LLLCISDYLSSTLYVACMVLHSYHYCYVTLYIIFIFVVCGCVVLCGVVCGSVTLILIGLVCDKTFSSLNAVSRRMLGNWAGTSLSLLGR